LQRVESRQIALSAADSELRKLDSRWEQMRRNTKSRRIALLITKPPETVLIISAEPTDASELSSSSNINGRHRSRFWLFDSHARPSLGFQGLLPDFSRITCDSLTRSSCIAIGASLLGFSTSDRLIEYLTTKLFPPVTVLH